MSATPERRLSLKRSSSTSIRDLRVTVLSRRREKRTVLLRRGARVGAWLLFAVAILLLCWLTFAGVRYVLLVRNAHFTVQRVDVNVYGQLSEAAVLEIVTKQGIETGKTNLFSLDLRKMRRQLAGSHVLIKQVVLSRVLPDTLRVDVYERDPVAHVDFGGRGVDMVDVGFEVLHVAMELSVARAKA